MQSKLPMACPSSHDKQPGAQGLAWGVVLCLCAALGGYAGLARAGDWTDAELKAMPPFCEARLNHVPGQYEHWNQVLGPDFLHTHHYCAGLGFINRYYRAKSSKDKQFNLNNAGGNLGYMVAHASPSYSLMPDVYLNLGLLQSLAKKDGAAIPPLLKALELDPKLVRAYTLTADIYTRMNQKDKALKLVTEGLRHAPEAASLQRLYKKLGGELPYPEPIARAPEAPAAAAPKSGDAEPAKPADPSPPQALPAPANPAPVAETKENAAPVAATPTPPKIGTSSNPWCRFCPEPAP